MGKFIATEEESLKRKKKENSTYAIIIFLFIYLFTFFGGGVNVSYTVQWYNFYFHSIFDRLLSKEPTFPYPLQTLPYLVSLCLYIPPFHIFPLSLTMSRRSLPGYSHDRVRRGRRERGTGDTASHCSAEVIGFSSVDSATPESLSLWILDVGPRPLMLRGFSFYQLLLNIINWSIFHFLLV